MAKRRSEYRGQGPVPLCEALDVIATEGESAHKPAVPGGGLVSQRVAKQISVLSGMSKREGMALPPTDLSFEIKDCGGYRYRLHNKAGRYYVTRHRI